MQGRGRRPKRRSSTGAQRNAHRRDGDARRLPCVKYEVFEEGVKVRELWVTDWNNVEGTRRARSGDAEHGPTSSSKLTASFGGSAGAGSQMASMRISSGGGTASTGMPVVTTDFENGTASKSRWCARSTLGTSGVDVRSARGLHEEDDRRRRGGTAPLQVAQRAQPVQRLRVGPPFGRLRRSRRRHPEIEERRVGCLRLRRRTGPRRRESRRRAARARRLR